MNPLIQFKKSAALILIPLVWLQFFSNAQAVVPPPDGGYPNFTTAEGQNALFSLTTGVANTAIGWFSLKSVTTGSFNTGVGAGTLVLNTGDENTAIGTAALLLNTASGNTAVGSRALLNNTTGGTLGNIQGFDFGPNVAVGQQALESNTIASANTAVGYHALRSFTTGPVGLEQLGLCTAVGFQALANATGPAIENSAFGYRALMNNTDGGGNTAVGFSALAFNTTGINNIAVGVNAGSSVTTADNVICIGVNLPGENVTHSCYIGNIFNQTSFGGTVFINSDGKLGTMTSSKRFKEEIKSMDKASEALFSLKPVAFRYKKEIDPAHTAQFGLVAEDVEKVNPDLVVRDKEGEAYSVRYDQVNAMLLNEFLKARRQIDAQQKQIEALTAGLQKVSAQLAAASPSRGGLEASKPAPQVVVNR